MIDGGIYDGPGGKLHGSGRAVASPQRMKMPDDVPIMLVETRALLKQAAREADYDSTAKGVDLEVEDPCL
jgi:hypothetical protein